MSQDDIFQYLFLSGTGVGLLVIGEMLQELLMRVDATLKTHQDTLNRLKKLEERDAGNPAG